MLRQIATYSEIMTNWNINDLADAHEALDMQDAAESWYNKQARQRAEQEARN